MEVKEMNTKEAIEIFEKKNISGDELLKMKIKNVKKLAKLLQQGEADSKELKIVKEELKKVWQMWEEFKFKRGDTYAILEQPDKGTIRDDMNSFEQKYFPKPVKKTITKEMIK